MKLYIADYLADTTHLTTVEHGTYVLLLMGLWRAGGRLPNDDLKLSKIAHLTPEQWGEIGPVVREFFTVKGGHLTQKRATEEIAKYQNVISSAKNAGKASAQKKGSKNNDGEGNVRSQSVARKFNQPKPEPELEEEPPIAPQGAEVGSLFGEDDLPIAKTDDVRVAFDLWVEMATRTGLPVPELLTDERRRKIKARLKDGGLDAWRRAIKAVEGSAFCRGQTPARDGHKPFRADLTFITQAQSYSRLLEGFYGQDAKPASASSREAPATTFTGPDEVRQAIMNRVHDRAFLDKWLNPAMWDGQNRVIIARTNHAADQLRQYVEGDLLKIGVTITGPRPNVVPFAREARSA